MSRALQNAANQTEARQNAQRLGVRLIGTAAFLSFLLSVALYFSGDKQAGIFVGIWVPSILSGGQFLFAGGRDV